MTKAKKLTEESINRRRHEEPQRTERKALAKILIVCEGEKTEPNYFKAFNKHENGRLL